MSHLSDFQIRALESAYKEYLRKARNLNFADEMDSIERKYNQDKKKKKSRDLSPPPPPPPPRRRRQEEEGEVRLLLPFRAHLYLPRKMDVTDIKEWLERVQATHGSIQIEIFKSESPRANLFIEDRQDYELLMQSSGFEDVKVFQYKR
jgi:hypothetical protein